MVWHSRGPVWTISGHSGRSFARFGGVKYPGVVVLLAACSFQASPAQTAPADGSSGGSGVDAMGPPPPSDVPACFGHGLVQLCLDSMPTQAVALPGAMNPLDTSVTDSCTAIVAQNNGPELCVIAGRTVTVSGSFAAIGARPLVLLASDAVNVMNTLDVSSTRTGSRTGAGANDTACPAGTNGKNDSGGGGGGAGGSFGTVGGTGGLGDRNNNLPPIGTAAGGTPGAALPAPAVLRGGCKGSLGGEGIDSDTSPTGGVGGDGGGAVYLIAVNSIMIAGNGNIFASGAGGSVSPVAAGHEQGGGGGGGGGMIGLDAPAIQIQGRIAANGGAGAGGGGNVGGVSGGDGTTMMWDMRAHGGSGDKTPGAGMSAGDGADGSTIGATNLDGNPGDAAGGGAGGGLGLVWTWGAVTGGSMISPEPVKH